MASVKITVIMASGNRIGPGKIALLESIQLTGSISAAARAMGMDYKRAWLLIDNMNQAFTSPVVERSTGGAGGGGAVLTSFGAEIMSRYRKLQAKVAKLAVPDLELLEEHARPETGPKV